jgi:DNA-nicking Smr family endonuclease
MKKRSIKDMQQNMILDNELELPELDLHGEPIHPAWGMFKEFVSECDQQKHKKARVVTGKGRILREFTIWATNHPKISTVYLEASGGSFLIQIIE